MFLTIAAASLPLIAISADDDRLSKPRTFLSDNASQAFAAEDGESVLCLDRKRDRYSSICLTYSEWAQAVELANDGEGKRKTSSFFNIWDRPATPD